VLRSGCSSPAPGAPVDVAGVRCCPACCPACTPHGCSCSSRGMAMGLGRAALLQCPSSKPGQCLQHVPAARLQALPKTRASPSGSSEPCPGRAAPVLSAAPVHAGSSHFSRVNNRTAPTSPESQWSLVCDLNYWPANNHFRVSIQGQFLPISPSPLHWNCLQTVCNCSGRKHRVLLGLAAAPREPGAAGEQDPRLAGVAQPTRSKNILAGSKEF